MAGKKKVEKKDVVEVELGIDDVQKQDEKPAEKVESSLEKGDYESHPKFSKFKKIGV